jgi:hypothetical protein
MLTCYYCTVCTPETHQVIDLGSAAQGNRTNRWLTFVARSALSSTNQIVAKVTDLQLPVKCHSVIHIPSSLSVTHQHSCIQALTGQ